MSAPVRISEIGLYLRCPRLVYFQNLGSLAAPEDAARMLLRALMFSLSSSPSSQFSVSDLQGLLEENLALLKQELPVIYEIDSALVESACRDLEPEIESISQGLAGSLNLLLPCEVEIDLRSEKLGLSGRLDRLVKK